MTRQDVRSQLWYLLHDAERESRYYGKLAARNKNTHLILSTTVITLSLLAAITLFIPLASSSTAALFLMISSFSVVMVVYDFSGRARDARTASDLLRGLQTEAKQAWYGDAESLTQEFVNNLERRLNAYIRIDITLDDKLIEQCADDANKVIHAEFLRRRTGASAAAETHSYP